MAFFKKETKPESHFTTPRFPVHPLIDVVTGELMKCDKGDYVLNGGYSPHMAISGKNNSNKTLIILSFIMTFLIRFKDSGVDAQMFETENTLLAGDNVIDFPIHQPNLTAYDEASHG